MFAKHIAHNEEFFDLQIALCKCKYLGALGLIRLWTHPIVTIWPSYIIYFWACEVNSTSKWSQYYVQLPIVIPQAKAGNTTENLLN